MNFWNRNITIIITILIFPVHFINGQNCPVITKLNGAIDFTDGAIDMVWQNVEAHEILMDCENSNPTASDFSAIWKAGYNKKNHELYILVNVTDDSVTSNDLIPEDSSWFADHITLYLDLFKDGFTNYNDRNYNFQFLPYKNGYSCTIGQESYFYGEYDYIDSLDKNKTANGWFIELLLSFENLTNNQELYYIDTIGFDVAITDNDNGYGVRKHRLAWRDLDIIAFQNPSLLGNVILDQKLNASFIPTCAAEFNYTDYTKTGSSEVRVSFNDQTETNDEIINWSWTFGDNSYISINNPEHIYNPLYKNTNTCLYITTKYGCNSSICKKLIPSPKNSLFGNINLTSDPTSEWYVIAFQKQNNQFMPVDQSSMDNNNFEFTEIKNGEYIFYAMPEEKDDNYFPTYFVNSLYWQKATVIPVDTNTFDIDIHLQPITFNLTGIATITGRLVNAQGNVPIILAGKNHNPLTYTLTSSNGKFKFNDLPFGEYYIYPEYPNYDNSKKYVLLNPENPVLDFTLNSITSVNINDNFNHSKYDIIYNKTQDELIINATYPYAKNIEIFIYNILGKKLLIKIVKLYETEKISLKNINSKTLIIVITDDKSFYTQKIIR